MLAIRCILVVVDPKLPESLALKRAHLIASVSQSRLHLLVCDGKHDHSAHLESLRTQLEAEGHNVSVQQAWNDSPHQTIINVQQAEGCGLVIKQHVPDNPLKRALLTPDDWKLLRYCPCPVLMVKTDKPWRGGKILAAVDVGNSDEEHRTLHATIVNHGYEIAELADGSLHVLSAHPSPMLSAADPTFHDRSALPRSVQALPDRIRDHRRAPAHRGRARRCADPSRVPSTQRGGDHHRHGRADGFFRRTDG